MKARGVYCLVLVALALPASAQLSVSVNTNQFVGGTAAVGGTVSIPTPQPNSQLVNLRVASATPPVPCYFPSCSQQILHFRGAEIPPNSTTGDFDFSQDVVSVPTIVVIEASYSVFVATTTVVLLPPTASLTLNPDTVTGSGFGVPVGTATLTIAPPLDQFVQGAFIVDPNLLSSSSFSLFAGSTSATFSIQAGVVAQETNTTVGAVIHTVMGDLVVPSQPLTILPRSPARLVIRGEDGREVTDISLQPTVSAPAPSPYGNDPQTTTFDVSCVNTLTNELVPNCDVQLLYNIVAGSGGHVHHDSNRPAGSFSPVAANTGSTGSFTLTYTSPEPSGQTNVTVVASLGGAPLSPVVFRIHTAYTGLVAMGNGRAGFNVNTASLGHDSNNQYLSQDVADQVADLPDEFRNELAPQQVPAQQIPDLTYVAMSLPDGGLFDVDANNDGRIDNPWHPPHASHRFGGDVDLRIRDIPRRFRQALHTAIINEGFGFPSLSESPGNPDANHWHLRSN